MEVIVVAAGLAAPDLKHSTSSMALRNSAPRQWRQSRSSATKINSFQKLPSVVLCRGYQLWYKQNCMSKFLPSSRTRIFWVASWKMRSAQGGSEQNIEKENSLKIQETKKTTGRNSFKIFEEKRTQDRIFLILSYFVICHKPLEVEIKAEANELQKCQKLKRAIDQADNFFSRLHFFFLRLGSFVSLSFFSYTCLL